VEAWWFSQGTLVSSTNKTDHHDITDIFLKVALTTITHPSSFSLNSSLAFVNIFPQLFYQFNVDISLQKSSCDDVNLPDIFPQQFSPLCKFT
jgi:hypothetical protein